MHPVLCSQSGCCWGRPPHLEVGAVQAFCYLLEEGHHDLGKLSRLHTGQHVDQVSEVRCANQQALGNPQAWLLHRWRNDILAAMFWGLSISHYLRAARHMLTARCLYAIDSNMPLTVLDHY